MFIKNLKINNFKNISDLDLTFSKLNLISGNTGSGKTAILEALALLIANHTEGNIAEYIKWSAKKFEIESEFSLDNKNYIYNIVGGKTNNRTLFIEGEDQPYKNSDATKKLGEVINSELVLYSNISMQGKSTQLLFEKPTPRLEKLKMIFGLQDIDNSVIKIKEKIDELKIQIEIVENEIHNLKNRKFEYQDVPDVEDYSQLEKQINDLEKEKEEYIVQTQRHIEYEKQLLNYQKCLQDIKKYSGEIEVNKKKFNDTSLYCLPVYHEKALGEFTQRKNDWEKNLIILENSIKDYNRYINLKEGLNKKIEEKNKELNNLIIKRIQPCEYNNKDVEEIEKEIAGYNSQIQLEKKHLELAKQGKCPTCGQNYILSVSDIEKELNALTLNKELLECESKEIKHIINDYDKKIFENEQIKTKRGFLTAQVQGYENELNSIKIIEEPKENKDEIKKDIERIKETILNCELAKKEYDRCVKENEETEKIRNKYNQDIAVLESKIEELQKISEPIKIKEPKEFDLNNFESLKVKLNKCIQLEAERKSIIKSNELTKKEESKNILLINDKENILEKLRKDISLLETSKKLIGKDFSSYLIDNGTEYIKLKMNEIFSKSYGRYSISLMRDEKGVDFYYSEEGKEKTSVIMASGFEKQLLSVSFRLALSNLQRLGIFIGDEIDSDASSEMSLRLFNTILNQKNIEQAFFISHKDDTKEMLSNLSNCTIFNMNDGKLV
jgi:DNA repair exonuclease SbcCD ATPase subunit